MKSDYFEMWFCLVVTVAVIAGSIFYASLSCKSRWRDSGFLSRYEIVAGCMIQYKGRWMPEDRYRMVDE